MFENVKALVSSKFKPYFNKWQSELINYGYSNFYEVLNAKDFGIPQSRERVFMVSIREGNTYFEFPKPFELTRRLKHILENKVEEKYYLSQKQVSMIANYSERKKAEGCGFKTNFQTDTGVSGTITTSAGNRVDSDFADAALATINAAKRRPMSAPAIRQVGNLIENSAYKNPQRGRIYSIEGISPYLSCRAAGLFDITQTLITPKWQDDKFIIGEYWIRKLTPREHFRLMDVSEEDIDKLISAEISNTQLYKLAGNSIVVACLYHIFRKMFADTEALNNKPKQNTLPLQTAFDIRKKNTTFTPARQPCVEGVTGATLLLPLAFCYFVLLNRRFCVYLQCCSFIVSLSLMPRVEGDVFRKS